MRGGFGWATMVAALIGGGCLRAPKSVETNPAVQAQQLPKGSFDAKVREHADQLLESGQKVFRDDTFGSEDFWGGQLRLHEAILGQELGGVGSGLTPKRALELGLKVDQNRVPALVVEVLRGGAAGLEDPKTTLELLRADAVVGVRGRFDDDRDLVAVGITCALCHSTVDDSFMKGIGRPLDGWPNRDLDVGAIVTLAPTLAPLAAHVGTTEEEVKRVLLAWGPGRYDAEYNQDGIGFRPDGKTAATVLPPAFGLAGQNLHTYAGWGSIPYWNAYVARTQMFGKGVFVDPRLDDADKFPVAARAGTSEIRDASDEITGKLAALHFYQLALPAPEPPTGSYDSEGAMRGGALFDGKARCAECHVPPLFSEPGWPMHTGAEIGIDDFQSSRSPDGLYRTTPLQGLFVRAKGGFYHDGRFPTLADVVAHYDAHFQLGLTEQEALDLVEYLKSI